MQLTARSLAIACPIDDHEILIMGGSVDDTLLSDALIFDVRTGQSKKVIGNGLLSFNCVGAPS